MILHFVKIMGLSELFHEKTPQIRFDAKLCLGKYFVTYDTKICEIDRSKNVKKLEFQEVEICQDNEFLR